MFRNESTTTEGCAPVPSAESVAFTANLSGWEVWLDGDGTLMATAAPLKKRNGGKLQSDLCAVTQQLLTVDKCFVLRICVSLVGSQVWIY